MKKESLRAVAQSRRQALSGQYRAEAAQTIASRALPFPIDAGAVMAGYMPIRGELDPRPLLERLTSEGAQCAMPTIAGNEQPLIFRAWHEGAPMQKGALGIQEPLADARVLVPDIVLVPLSAFDRRGHRIGYGAGHYDRALGHLRLEKPVIAVGIAFALQECPRVPDEAHDVPLDFVITERETIDCRSE